VLAKGSSFQHCTKGRKLGSIAWQRPLDWNSSSWLSAKSGSHSQHDGFIAPRVLFFSIRAMLHDNVTSILFCERSFWFTVGTSHSKHFAQCFFLPAPTFHEYGHTCRVDRVCNSLLSVAIHFTSQINLVVIKCEHTRSVRCRFTKAVVGRTRTPNGHVLAPCRHFEALHVAKVMSLLTTHSVSCGMRSTRFGTAKSLCPCQFTFWCSKYRSCFVVQTSSHAEPLVRECSHAC